MTLPEPSQPPSRPPSPPPPTPAEPAAPVPWFSVWQFLLSLLAAAGLLVSAFLVLIFALAGRFGLAAQAPEMGDSLPLFLLAAGMTASGLLLVPSILLALQRLPIWGGNVRPALPASRPPARLERLYPGLLILLLPVVLALGYWISGQAALAWLVLPPLHVAATALPVLWLLYVAQRGLPLGSAQRAWGVLGSGLVLGPALILLAELLILVVFIAAGVAAIAANPTLSQELQILVERLMYDGLTPESARRLLEPYLLNPGLILAALTYLSVAVPLIEELLKPVGVWLLAGRGLSPAEGFTAGLISGAGYALFESLVALPNTGDEWLFLVVARIGTAVIHILTTGLVGWALALAWSGGSYLRGGKYLRLGAAYLTAVAIHGLWNSLSLVAALSGLAQEPASLPLALLSRFGSVAPPGLGLLTLGAFVVLLVANRALRRGLFQARISDPIPDKIVEPEKNPEPGPSPML